MNQQDKAPSTLSTGGAGTEFEYHAGTMFLALLLTRGIPVVFKDCQVDEVAFQTRRLGWQTDDLLITCSSTQQKRRKLAIQVKRTFRATAGFADCKETFQGFWKDFKNANRFNPDCDALVLITLNAPRALQDGLGRLLDCAGSASDEADFAERLAKSGLYSKRVRDCHSVIRDIVVATDSETLSDEDLWRFLKSVHLLSWDLTTPTAQHEAFAKHILAMSCPLENRLEMADATWSKLIETAAAGATNGRTLTRNDLPEDLLTRHQALDPAGVRMQPLRDHTQLVLDGINSRIAGTVTLARVDLELAATKALSDSRAMVLTGPPGCGKSALAKSVALSYQVDDECFSFRGEEFAASSIDGAFRGRMTRSQLKVLLGAQRRVLIHVESVERLLEHTVRDAFADLVRIAEECDNVYLLLTCRDYAAAAAVTAFFERGNLQPVMMSVPPLTDSEMGTVAEALPKLAAPFANPRIKDFLRNPFLLDMAARLDWSREHQTPLDVASFRSKCWNLLVRRDDVTAAGMPGRREKTLIDLAERRARELRPFVPADGLDHDALEFLHQDGVVAKDGNDFVAPVHDVIEDWAIIRWTELLFAKHQWQARQVAEEVGEHPAMRRGFREWLQHSLELESDRTDHFVLSCYADDDVPRHFRDDVIVSMLRSSSVGSFLSRQKTRLLARDGELLAQVIHLLRVACQRIPRWLGGRYAPPSVWLEPYGDAWPAVLNLVAEEFDAVAPTHSGLLLRLVEDWSRGGNASTTAADGADSVGRIAYGILDRHQVWRGDDRRKRVLEVIAKVPLCDGARFTELVAEASDLAIKRDSVSADLAEILLGGIEGATACRDFPELIASFALSWWLLSNENSEAAFPYWMPDPDHEFGLRRNATIGLFPPSAFQGPFLWLLKQHPEIGVRLVLSLANHVAEWYGERMSGSGILEPPFQITISVPGHGKLEQWANERLWLAYRGTSVTPYVIQSALMALEYWLLELCENGDPVESWLTELLVESNNVMTTAVVASVCNAYPATAGTAALALLTSRAGFGLDLRRKVKERDAEALNAMSNSLPIADRHRKERERSNALEHRVRDLEFLASQLQFAGQSQEVWEILDRHYDGIPDGDDRTDDDRRFLLALHRMDARKWELGERIQTSPDASVDDETDERVAFSTQIRQMDDDLQSYVDASAQINEPVGISIGLLGWCLAEWEGRQHDSGSMAWPTALARAKELGLRQQPATDFDHDAVGYTAALCIRDHWQEMSADDRQWCLDTVIAEVGRECDSADHMVRISNHTLQADRPAAFVLPMILSLEPDNPLVLTSVARSVTHASDQVKHWCTEGVRRYLTADHQDILMRCAGAFAMSARMLDEQERQARAEFAEQGKVNRQSGGIGEGIKRQLSRLVSGSKTSQLADFGWHGPRVSADVRRAFLNDEIDSEAEIAGLDFGTWPARSMSTPLSSIAAVVTGSALAKELHMKMAQAVAESWEANRNDHDVAWQFDSNYTMMQGICAFVLTLPAEEALHCCRPFLDAVAEFPSEVDGFITCLIAQEDITNSDQSCFWDIWNAIADNAANAPWAFLIDSPYSEATSLVEKILFALPWKEGVSHWQPLESHSDDVDAFVARMPAARAILAAYTRYLHSIGRRSLPNAFSVVAKILRYGEPAELLSDGNTAFYLEVLLGRYVHGEPTRLKSLPTLRDDVLYILDQLVAAGSSAAYIMRDDFVTPVPAQIKPTAAPR